MTALQVAPPYPIFTDANGLPLDNGFVYIGEPKLNPETNPKAVYWDSALTQQVAQPIRTVNGYPSNAGSPAIVYANGQYSITIRSQSGALITYTPVNYGVETSTANGAATPYNFTGDGSTVSFALGEVPSSEDHTWVFLSGVYQNKTTYAISGLTLTFSTAPPNGVEIEVMVLRPPSMTATTDASAVSYTPEGAGAVVRTVQSRLRDRGGAVTDFGGVAGAVDSSTAVQAAIDAGGLVWLPSGAWNAASVTPAATSVFTADTDTTISFTFDNPLVKGNRFTFGGDYEPTLGQLGHPAPNKGNSWQNALQVTRGTQTAPDSTNLYARTAAYIEMHTSKVHSASQSSWGNPYMTPALTVENQAHTTFQGALAGAAFRAYSTEVPAGATPPLASLVGIYAIGQTNTGAGNNNYSVWGANFIAAETTGNPASGCVGIEVDLVHSNGATSGAGPSPGNNYTGYWAQSDAQGVYSTAAFYSSRTASSLGWNYHFYSTTAARNWAIYLVNPSTVTAASGIHIQTAAAAGTALEASTAGYNTTSGNGPNVMSLKSRASGVSQTQMVVTSNASNPVNIRVGGGLETVLVGAADSGGVGFRMLRVAN